MTKQFEVGIVVKLEKGPEKVIKEVHEMGFRTCQISVYDPHTTMMKPFPS